MPQLSVDSTTGKVKALAGNVECESLFLISRGSELPRPLFAKTAVYNPAYPLCGEAAAAEAATIKAPLDSSVSPVIPSLAWSQSSYGSKVAPFFLLSVDFLHTSRSVCSSQKLSSRIRYLP